MKRVFIFGFIFALLSLFTTGLATASEGDCIELYKQGLHEINEVNQAIDDYLKAYAKGDQAGMNEARREINKHMGHYANVRGRYYDGDCEDVLGKPFPFPAPRIQEVPGL